VKRTVQLTVKLKIPKLEKVNKLVKMN